MTVSELLFATPAPSLMQIVLVVLGVLGVILMSYGIFLEKERLQDAVFMLGALLLTIYSISVENLIFSIAFGVFFLGSTYEYFTIATGRHKHVCYPCTSSGRKPKDK